MKRSTNVIVSNLSGDNILLPTFYAGAFLLFDDKVMTDLLGLPMWLLSARLGCLEVIFLLLRACL